MSQLVPTSPDVKERLIGLALDGLASRHTRRAYRAALDEFLTWSQGQQPSVLEPAESTFGVLRLLVNIARFRCDSLNLQDLVESRASGSVVPNEA